MGFVNKRLAAGVISAANTNTVMYTSPTNKITIVKSFILCNMTTSNLEVIFRLANLEVLYRYNMKPSETIAVPIMDQVMVAGEQLSLYVYAASALSYYISGIEADINDVDYGSVKKLGADVMGSISETIVRSSTKDRLIKGMILCNTTSSDKAVTIKVGSITILSARNIKSYDTILVPCMDQLIPATEIMTGLGSGVNYYITGKELS
jgi:hypothetical protein